MMILLPTFVQKKTLAIPSLPFTRNSKRPFSLILYEANPD